MDTSSPAVASAPPRPARRRFARPLLHAAPVLAIAVYGAVWIAVHSGGGRGSAHTIWQSLALAEASAALLLRRRKPMGALAGILAAYVLFGLDLLLLPAVLLALLTVARLRDRRTLAVAAIATGAAVAVMPYIHGDAASLAYSLPRLAAAGATAAAGTLIPKTRSFR